MANLSPSCHLVFNSLLDPELTRVEGSLDVSTVEAPVVLLKNRSCPNSA